MELNRKLLVLRAKNHKQTPVIEVRTEVQLMGFVQQCRPFCSVAVTTALPITKAAVFVPHQGTWCSQRHDTLSCNI
jgi:hypothetical protein